MTEQEVTTVKRFLLVAACLIFTLAIAIPASAVVIGDDELVGGKNEATPANLANETLWSNLIVTWYNGGANPGGDFFIDPPDPTAPIPSPVTGGVTFGDLSGGTLGYDYLWAKLGVHGALYYIGDLTMDVTGFDTVSQFTGSPGQGLSHIVLFNAQVPEPGTVMLLGFGLAGVATFRRFRKC
jgi:opacity protein-like surface antigen